MTQLEKDVGIQCMPGTKPDEKKLRWDLLPWNELEDIVRSLTWGAVKYTPDDNWKKVEPGVSRYTAALMRHLVAHLKGENIDKETGIPHLALVAVDALFALWHHKNKHPEKYKDYQAACNNLLYRLQHKEDLEENTRLAQEKHNHNATGMV